MKLEEQEERKLPALKPTDIRCKIKNCRGTLWNITLPIQERLGFIVLKCDKGCGTWAVQVEEKKFSSFS